MGWFKCTVCNKKLRRSLGKRLQNSSILHWAACAPAHRFFTTLKSHKVVQTGHRSMGSFVMPFSSLVRMGKQLLRTLDRWIRNTVSVHGAGDGESWLGGWTDVLSVCYHPYLVSLLYADLLSIHLIFLMLFGLICNTKWTITLVYWQTG